MTNTFADRVTAEREILRIVNEALPFDSTLNGLSRKAIEAWGSSRKTADNDGLIDLLLDCGSLCQLLSDRSHETFRDCLLYTSPSPRDATLSRMPSSA